jgi:copper homeostasis protein
MNFELCTSTYEGAASAAAMGFKRIELCNGLEVGGLTPSVGLAERCVKLPVEVHVMIRHRSGGFHYSEEAIAIMKRDIEIMGKIGVDGVVFGVLDTNNNVSEDNKALVAKARSYGMEATFHRAFDQVTDPLEAVEQLIAFGFDRLLTSGQRSTAIEGIELIGKLQEKFGNHIQIMAGSGVTAENALALADTGIKELHFTAHKQNETGSPELGLHLTPDLNKMADIQSLF